MKRGFSLVIQTHAKIMENATPLMIIHFNVVVLKVRLLNPNFLSLKNLGVVSKFIIIGDKEKCVFFPVFTLVLSNICRTLGSRVVPKSQVTRAAPYTYIS